MFLFRFAELEEQFQVHNLYKTHKSTKKKWVSHFGLIKKIMDLSFIPLAVEKNEVHKNQKELNSLL